MLVWEKQYDLWSRLIACSFAVVVNALSIALKGSYFEQYPDSVSNKHLGTVSCGLLLCQGHLGNLIPGALARRDENSLFKADPCRPRVQMLEVIVALASMATISMFIELIYHMRAVCRGQQYYESVRYLSAVSCSLQFMFMVLFFAGFTENFGEGGSLQCTPGSYQGLLGTHLSYGPFLVLVSFLFHVGLVVRKFVMDRRYPEEAERLVRGTMTTEETGRMNTAAH